MPIISLTTFIDFVVATGTARITRVRKAKEQYHQGYSPAFDFYRGVRNGIIRYHNSGEPLRGLINDIRDAKKRKAYRSCVRGHERWMGRRQFDWVQPESSVIWPCGELEVRVNPELGLTIENHEYRIKMYFKADQLSKTRVDPMLHLIKTTLTRGRQSLRPGILDVQRGKLWEPTIDIADLEALLVAEATAFMSMWNSLRI